MTRTRSLLDLLPWARPRDHIFISYRRKGDSAGFAARLADRLVAHFGADQCFRDIEDIDSGVDFVHAIQEAVHSCRTMIVVIGTDWATMSDAQGRRRLENPRDFVRLEVETALERDVRVIPVLVSGAKMPSETELPEPLKPLSRRQAHELSDSRWDYDVGRLLASIERLGVKPRGRRKRGPAGLSSRAKAVTYGLVSLVLVGLGVGLGLSAVGDGIDSSGSYADPAGDPVDGATTGSGPGEPEAASSANEPDRAAVDPGPAGSEPEPRTTAPTVAVPPETSVMPEERSLPDPAALLRVELVDAVEMANDEEIYAQETLDGEGLPEIYEGNALQMELVALAQLVAEGQVSENILLEQHFQDFRIDADRGLAEVDVLQVWASERRNALTGGCLYRTDAHEAPQTLFLRRSYDGWMVYDVVFHESDEMPSVVACQVRQ